MEYVKLELSNVSKKYEEIDGNKNKNARKNVINELSLKIYNHEFICVLGHSGCGKSTLLNLIAGYIKPDTGSITMDNNEKLVTGPSRERGVVFQEHALFPWYTVEENIAFGPNVCGVSKHLTKKLVDTYIKTIGLEEYRKSYPDELSGGMKQRVGIARAFANAADVLLMDEPFSALDEFTRSSMQESLLSIWEQHKNTIIFITHSIEEAVYLANRVIIMGNGNVLVDKKIELSKEERVITNPKFFEYVNDFKSYIEH